MEKVKASYTNLKKGKSILRWIFAVTFILFGFSAFEFSIIGGLLYILLGIFLVPQISNVLSNHDKLKFSQNNIVWYSIVLFLLIGAGYLGQLGEIDNKKSDFFKNKTSILAEIEKDINNNSFSDASSKIKKHLDLLPQDEELKNLKIAIEDKKEQLEKKAEQARKLEDQARKLARSIKTIAVSAICNGNQSGTVQTYVTQMDSGGIDVALNVLRANGCSFASNNSPKFTTENSFVYYQGRGFVALKLKDSNTYAVTTTYALNN